MAKDFAKTTRRISKARDFAVRMQTEVGRQIRDARELEEVQAGIVAGGAYNDDERQSLQQLRGYAALWNEERGAVGLSPLRLRAQNGRKQ